MIPSNQREPSFGTAASRFLARVQGRLTRGGARLFYRRLFKVKSDIPIVSFTFDDFPRSALLQAAPILKRYGASATYYISLGLIGKQSPLGPMFQAEDLGVLAEQGHELGCHTFQHCHSSETLPATFEKSIIDNRQALKALLPEASFRTFSYPISAPRLGTKMRASTHFLCCRGGGQTFNAGTIDLNWLSAFFLEQSRDDPKAVKDLIDQNTQKRGWLIFATHDICDTPSPFGCTSDFFEQVVCWAVASGARILPVLEALRTLKSSAAQ